MPRLAYLLSSLLLLAVPGCFADFSPDDELGHLLAQARVECGTLMFDNVEDECPQTDAALQCFASADRPHIEQVFISDEGDPMFEHFFLEDGRAIMIRDTRADDWGPQEITRTECATLAPSDPTVSGCLHIACDG